MRSGLRGTPISYNVGMENQTDEQKIYRMLIKPERAGTKLFRFN